MTDSLPFAVSVEVEEWLSKITLLPHKQPGFSCSPRYGLFNGGDLVEEFRGEHYSIVHTSSEAWLTIHAVQMVIGTRMFWIPPDTLDKLRGKRLTVIETNVSLKQDEPKIRSFLVAAEQ